MQETQFWDEIGKRWRDITSYAAYEEELFKHREYQMKQWDRKIARRRFLFAEYGYGLSHESE